MRLMKYPADIELANTGLHGFLKKKYCAAYPQDRSNAATKTFHAAKYIIVAHLSMSNASDVVSYRNMVSKIESCKISALIFL